MITLTLVVLFVIALELGWLIFTTVKRRSQPQDGVVEAIDRLREEQKDWSESLRQLAAKSGDASEDGKSPRTPATNGLLQLQTRTNELLAVLQQLSASVSQSQDRHSSSFAESSERIIDLLEQISSRVDNAYMQIVTELRTDRQESLTVLQLQSDNQSKVLTNVLREVLKEDRPPAKLLQSERPMLEDRSSSMSGFARSVPPPPITAPMVVDNHVAPDSGISTQSSNRRSSVSGPSATASSEFEKLQSWVSLNLSQIMNRSLNQWNKPEELFRGATTEKGYSARLLDPNSKLVVVSVEDTSQYLVIALPGGYIDPRYYEWFNLPKGIGARVERTMKPAIVETTDLGFRVLQRGHITQD